MPDFMSAKEAAEKWNISQRRVSVLCSQNRISGAMMVGNMWIIPSVAQKPVDKRTVKRGNKKAVSFKPFVKWVGGKGQLIGELKKTLEAAGGKSLGKYCEPMVGGGALLFYVLSEYNFREIFICDSNAELINAYMAIKDNPEELISKLAEMQSLYLSLDENGRNHFYYSVRDKFNNADKNGASATEKAAYFIFLNKTCFNGLYRVNKKGKFNVPAGAYKNPAICDCENLRHIHKALQNVQIVCGDYTSAKNFIDKNTFVYFDPPYRPISATSAFTSYNSDTFDDGEQVRLARFIYETNSAGAKFVLSNSDPKNTDAGDNFFDELYAAYNIKRVSASRMINSKGGGRGKINELLINN